MRPFRKTVTQTDAEKAHKPFSARLRSFVKGFFRFAFLLLLALGTAWLVKQSYPKVSNHMLAWLALAPFIWGVTKLKGFWTSFFYSWFTAVLINAGIYYWIYYTCVHGGGLSNGLSLAAWLGLSALLGLQFAVFGGSCFFLKKLGNLFPVLAACGVVALEWLHQTIAFYGLGFPWFMLGYTQWNAPEMIQIASFTGVYGVTFAVAFTGISVGYAFATSSLKRAVFHMILAGLVFLGLFAYGKSVLGEARRFQPLLSIPVALMQPDIDQYKKWSPEFEEEIIQTVLDMGRETDGKNRLLTVWPESVTPGPVQDPQYRMLFEDLATQSGSAQLLGSNTDAEGKQYVSAYLVEPGTDGLQVYHKEKLVPFGEYIPLETTVRSLFKNVAVLGELGVFSPGPKDQKLMSLPGVPFGTTVCYESIFPQLWLGQNRDGAKFFVNITNDAWYFDTDAPYQHLAVNVLRAVELGRPVLRAANTGISAVIDPLGRIEYKLDLNTRGILYATIPLPVGDNVNFYTQWGDWFAWLCAAFYFTLLISTFVFAYE